ncbi:MAG: xanthine dehydrogenase family protein subunit M [Burkholderiaceae bacterium]|nr:xanthine dehydrogenase family protein subunit M [Burkholderiaceae bacterium]
MKPPKFQYEAPSSLKEALGRMAELGDTAKFLAGGQSLVPAMNMRLATPEYLIDLGRIEALRGIRELPDGGVQAGALTTHAAFERSELLQRRMPLIPAVMRFVAHAQIRNRGTIGGSLAHADPAAEWQAVCIALDATVVVTSAQGQRRVKAADFTQGVYTTDLQPGELIEAVEFPAWPAQRRWGFEEVSRRLGDFAITGALCTLELDAGGLCKQARCVVFAASPKPVVIEAASALLNGRIVTDEAIAAVALAARAAVEPMSDHHASAEYRLELVETLTARVLRQALSS